MVQGRNRDHNIPEFNKGSCLDWYINVRNVPQAEIDQLLVLFLPQPTNEACARHLLPEPVCCQAILGKAEVEQASDRYRGRAKLFLLLDEVGAADEANGAFVTEGGQELKHFGSDSLT
jgi:hypothetical protein